MLCLRDRCRWTTALFCVVLLGLTLTPPAEADLAISFPPGSPLEWLIELPFHVIEPERSPIYTHAHRGDKKTDGEGGSRTGVVKDTKKKTKSVPPRAGAFNPLAAARVITHDIPLHITWTTYNRVDRVPGTRTYPPEIRADLHWLIHAAILRTGMHPHRTSVAETANYLIAIGAPVGDVLEEGPSGGELMRILRRTIRPTPETPPSYRALLELTNTAEEQMLVRWASRDLVADHYYAYNPLYARRTLALGSEAIPILLVCSHSKHPVLRQNAAGILASYANYDDDVLERLRALARGKDWPTSYRCLAGLQKWEDPQAEELLLGMLRSKDRIRRSYAMHLLGKAHASSARADVLTLLRQGPSHGGENWMTAIHAISRMGDPKGAVRDRLREIIRIAANPPKELVGGPTRWAPDRPDQPTDRAGVILQAARLALARLGNPSEFPYVKTLFETLEGPRIGAIPAPYPQIYEFNQLFAVEVLGELPEGAALLRGVFRSASDMTLRSVALKRLSELRNTAQFLQDVAADPTLATVLRVQAMKHLEESENTTPAAVNAAHQFIVEYLEADPRPKLKAGARGKEIRFFACAEAVRLLGRKDPAPAQLLIRILTEARARKHFEKARMVPTKARHGTGAFVMEYYPPLFEIVVAEFGRRSYPNSVWVLENLLAAPKGPGRVEAALALGNVPTRAVCDLLIRTLTDDSPWVRYAAYRSLKKISGGQEFFADWLFGSDAAIETARDQWVAWLAKQPPEVSK